MKVQFFCPRWGSEDLEWPLFFEKVKREGYDGIEWGIASNTGEEELDMVFELSERLNMPIIAQHYDTNDASPVAHMAAYRQWLERILPYPVLKINSQTGKDYFGFVDNARLINLAIDMATKAGRTIVHETHRNKWSFACHLTTQYLKAIPRLQLALDASHWVCVGESYLQDQGAALSEAIERAGHVHARVGYPEGPQVPDPRVPAWKEALDHHLGWWDRIAARYSAAGETLTITPEAGPYPYMVHLPETGAPIVSQWDVNAWMMRLLKERYQG